MLGEYEDKKSNILRKESRKSETSSRNQEGMSCKSQGSLLTKKVLKEEHEREKETVADVVVYLFLLLFILLFLVLAMKM